MYTNGNIYRKSDGKYVDCIGSYGWNVTSLTFEAKRLIEARGLNFDNFYVVCLDNQKHTASAPHHMIDGKVKRYYPKK